MRNILRARFLRPKFVLIKPRICMPFLMKWRCIMQNKQQKRQAEKLQKSIQQQRRNKKSDKLSSEKRKDGNTSFFARTGKFFSRKEVRPLHSRPFPIRKSIRMASAGWRNTSSPRRWSFSISTINWRKMRTKRLIFENYCDFLNYFDSSIRVQLSFVNSNGRCGGIPKGNRYPGAEGCL